VVIIAVVCVAATLLPQGAEVAGYLRKNPSAAPRMELFEKLGLTHIFYSWWFAVLLCVLASSVAVCSTRRFATVRRTTGFARGRALGSMLTHISFLLIMAGGVIRATMGIKGYLEFREGQTQAQFRTDRGAGQLPFALRLAKFEIETYDQNKEGDSGGPDAARQNGDALLVALPENNLKATLPVKMDVEQEFAGFKITVLQYVPDFVIDASTKEVTTRSNEPRNPAILVAVNGPNYHNHRWLFAKFPDFSMPTKGDAAAPDQKSGLQMVYQSIGAVMDHVMPSGPIKSFKSTFDVIDAGAVVVKDRTIEVNSPFSYKGYTFYQSGYNPEDLTYTSFQITNDPGVPVVYAGFGLMLVGLSIVFYINPWLDGRRKKA
jgi:cytochrome c biogenesis protein ResB